MTEHTTCPCGAPAEIIDRYTSNGSPAPVEHIATICAVDRSHNYVHTM